MTARCATVARNTLETQIDRPDSGCRRHYGAQLYSYSDSVVFRDIFRFSFQNHAFINIIPIYKDQKLEKKQANEEELKELQSKLETKKRGKRIPKKQTKTKSSNLNLPEVHFRIPGF